MSFSKWIALITFLTSSSGMSMLQANAQLTCDTMDHRAKIYLKPGSLLMDASSLYVHFDGDLYPVKHVSADDNGVYIHAKELENSKFGIWVCPNGHPNPPWNLACDACGALR